MTDSAFYDKLGADLLTDEGLRLKAYQCTAGRWTIGVGRNLQDRGITKDEALLLLDNDMVAVVGDLTRTFPWYAGLSESRRRALANMCFNVGLSRLQGFHNMLRAFEVGDYASAAAEALNSQWATQVGKRAERIAELIRGAP